MKPASFQYFAPTTINEALALLAQYGTDAKLLAGGQSLVPMLNFRLAAPAVLIDLNRVADLAFIRSRELGVSIGAMTRQRVVERDKLVATSAPLVTETIPFVAHPQIRNRGTFGGSLAHADPAAELPAVATALDAQMQVKSQRGERWVSARNFFTGMFTTALDPDELLTEIVFPLPPSRTGWSFQEIARRSGDFALAGAAAVVTLDPRGKCQNAKLVFMGLGAQAIDAVMAVNALKGALPTTEAIRAVANSIDAEIDPQSDIHASAKFRRHLAQVLTERTLTVAVTRARGDTA